SMPRFHAAPFCLLGKPLADLGNDREYLGGAADVLRRILPDRFKLLRVLRTQQCQSSSRKRDPNRTLSRGDQYRTCADAAEYQCLLPVLHSNLRRVALAKYSVA